MLVHKRGIVWLPENRIAVINFFERNKKFQSATDMKKMIDINVLDLIKAE